MARAKHNTGMIKGNLVFDVVAKTILLLLTAFCLFPFILMIIGSFSDNATVLREGYSFLPSKLSTAAYEIMFLFPNRIISAYRVTVTVTICGSLFGVFCISMAGYVLMRTDLRSRNTISFLIYFTSIFQGGLIPWYILITNYLKLSDSLLALILPSLMNPFLIILMRNFMKQFIPMELIESAKIDGANDILIFFRIVFQLATPGIATVGLFLALGYWNEWYMSMLYMRTPTNYSLQFYLYNMLNAAKALAELAAQGGSVNLSADLPSETTKLAMAVVATGPVIMVYPFIQRYFVSGLTIGAVKG
jgi:putative aldouronate transport system permease protein